MNTGTFVYHSGNVRKKKQFFFMQLHFLWVCSFSVFFYWTILIKYVTRWWKNAQDWACRSFKPDCYCSKMNVRCVYTPMHCNVLLSLLNPTPFQALLGKSLPALGMDIGLTGVCSDSVIKSSVVALHWSACKHTETWRSEPWEKLRVCRTDILHEHQPQEHEVAQICLPSIFIWHPMTVWLTFTCSEQRAHLHRK